MLKPKFSKRYIFLCQKAKELQNLFQDVLKKSDNEIDEQLEGSWIYHPEWGVELLFNGESFISDFKEDLKHAVWLPLQGQLDRLLIPFYISGDEIDWIELYEDYLNHLPVTDFESPEEWKLHVVMKTLFGKVWDEEKKEWIKIRKGDTK